MCVYRIDHCRCTGDSDGEDMDCPHVIHDPVYYGFYKNVALARFLGAVVMDNDELTEYEEKRLFHLLYGLPSLEAYIEKIGIDRVRDPNDKNVRRRAFESVQLFNSLCRSEPEMSYTVDSWIAFHNGNAQIAYDHHVSQYNALKAERDDDSFLSSIEAAQLWDTEKSGHQYDIRIVNGVCTVF